MAECDSIKSDLKMDVDITNVYSDKVTLESARFTSKLIEKRKELLETIVWNILKFQITQWVSTGCSVKNEKEWKRIQAYVAQVHQFLCAARYNIHAIDYMIFIP